LSDLWLYQIALSKIPSVGGVIARTLVSYCGGCKEVFTQRKRQLLKIPGVGERLVQHIQNPEVLRLAEAELVRVMQKEITCIFYLDDTYPQRLRHYPQSPIILYGLGNMNLNPERVVAIVGTRQPSSYGKSKCEQIVADLAAYNPLIISGLAYGVDITAHRAALHHQLSTIGVMGSGFGHLYPGTHRHVANQMMDAGGLLTEFGYDIGPDRENFPARNRIVAGLADAILVIESARNGGSMITVEYADAFHKDIFALPGRAGDPCSVGCNHLIKTQRAHLVESGEDIAALLRWTTTSTEKVVQRRLFADLTEPEQLLMTCMTEGGEMHIDAIASKAKMQQSELASVLLSLEFKGVVKALPGKRYLVVS
jgi:DNA processing protein